MAVVVGATMPLSAGTNLEPYEILSHLLTAGGGRVPAHAAKHVGRQQTAFSRSVQEASPTRLAPLCIPRRFCGSPERLRTKRNQNYSAPADQHWMALSLKPANFGRHANFIWALHHLSSNARDLGTLFLDFQKLLAPPTDRRGDGSSHRRGIRQFPAIHEHRPVLAVHAEQRHPRWPVSGPRDTLLSRTPFHRKAHFCVPNGPIEQLLGFECFHWIRLWRCFLQWLGNQLELYLQPGHFDHPAGPAFLKDLRRALRRRFHPRSFVFDDEAIRARALAVFTPQFGAKRELQQIARLATDRYWKGSTATLPVWEPMSRQWAAPTPTPVKLQCPTFAAGPLGRDAQAFAAALERAGKAQDLKEVKEALGQLQRE